MISPDGFFIAKIFSSHMLRKITHGFQKHMLIQFDYCKICKICQIPQTLWDCFEACTWFETIYYVVPFLLNDFAINMPRCFGDEIQTFDRGKFDIWVFPYMVVPPKHPKCWSFFSRVQPLGLLGKPSILGCTPIYLGGGFKYFLFSHLLGEDFHFD